LTTALGLGQGLARSTAKEGLGFSLDASREISENPTKSVVKNPVFCAFLVPFLHEMADFGTIWHGFGKKMQPLFRCESSLSPLFATRPRHGCSQNAPNKLKYGVIIIFSPLFKL